MKTLVFGTVAALLLVAMPVIGRSRTLDSLSAADFPAHVQALVFACSNGPCQIDQDHAVTWGTWRVTFGSEIPTAAWGFAGGSYVVNIAVLSCTNDVAGTQGCKMVFFKSGNRPWVCNLIVPPVGTPGIGINCPAAVEF